MVTVNGVYLDLKESKFIYKENDYKFYFSSSFNLARFQSQFKQFRLETMARLERSTKMKVFVDTFILQLLLYNQIEKRGFYVVKGGIEICQKEDINLVLKSNKN